MCCQCNRSGSCKNCQCVKLGRMCDGCLPGRLGNCHNSTHAAPSPAPAPANMSAAPTMETTSMGNGPVPTACLLSIGQQPCAGAFTMGQTASASSRSVNVCPPSVPGTCQPSPLSFDSHLWIPSFACEFLLPTSSRCLGRYCG